MPTHWLVRSKIQHRLERLSEREYSSRLPIFDIIAWFAPHYVPYRELDLSLFSSFQTGTLWGADGAKGYFHLGFTLPADARYPRFAPVNNFVDAILGKASNLSPGTVGRTTVDFLDAAYRSAAADGSPIAVDARTA